MNIQCTKKLLDELKRKPVEPVAEPSLYSWHANVITVNRKKVVVLVNDKNRYVIVLHGLKAKDFQKMDELLLDAIRATLEEECVKQEIIDQFLQAAGQVSFTKTKDRSSVARMNKACDMVYFFGELIEADTMYQGKLGKRVSRDLVGDRKGDYFHPNEAMYQDLESFPGESVFRCRAVEVKVTLDLEHHQVWRRMVVPLHLTFDQFHRVLQTVFDWKDYHLYDFYLYEKSVFAINVSWNHSGYHKEGYKPLINLVCDEEAFAYGDEIPMKLAKECKLADYLTTSMKYNYDFGDNWQHYIDVVQLIDNYDKNYPVCLEAEGDAPPEDVGGEGGYDEFLSVLADKTHPDYEHFITWAKGQRYQPFDMEKVNHRLKYM